MNQLTRKLKQCAAVMIGGSLTVISMTAWPASFECKGPLTRVERIICTDPTISQLDDELATAYLARKAQTEHASRISQTQRRWLIARNACKDRACVSWAYETRLGQLRWPAPSSELQSGEKARNGSSVVSGEAAENPAIGNWDAGSRAFWGQDLEVTDRVLTFDSCPAVPYIVTRDDYGADLNMVPHEPQERWRKIALELPPQNKPTQCPRFRVFEFAVPDNHLCHAEVAMFKSQEEYAAGKVSAWGVWGNKECRK